MSYNKTTWVDHLKSSNTFNISQNADGTYNITPAGNVIQQGTPMSAENLNHIEDGIVDVNQQCAINRTTLGTQCSNLHDTLSVNWYQPGKTSVASDGTVTTTITSDSRSFTYANSEHYITLEAGNYIITVNTLEFVAGSSALIRGCSSDNQSLFSLSVSSAGVHKAAFSLSEKTTIGIMYKLYSQTCTIMIRDADILDDTYEPYFDNVDTRLTENKSNTAINKTTLGYQCKNLCPVSGGSITEPNYIIGTGTSYYPIKLEPNTYTISWECITNDGRSNIEFFDSNKTLITHKVLDNSANIKFNIIIPKETNYFRLYSNTSNTISNLMIRYADITDSSYEPYQPSVQEQISALISRIEVLENK